LCQSSLQTMKKIEIFLIFSCCVSITFGHGWMTIPQPREPTTTNQNTPCETTTPESPVETVNAGENITVAWIQPHPTSAGDVVISMAPTGNSDDSSAFTPIATVPYVEAPNANGDSQVSVTIPESTAPGPYTIQWTWPKLGYLNCADITVLAAVPPGAELVAGSTTVYMLASGHGTFDAQTGVYTCDSGYKQEDGDCVAANKSNLSPGAAFGVAILVVFVVGAATIIGVVVYLKKNKPDTYNNMMVNCGRGNSS